MVKVTAKPDAIFMFDTQVEDKTSYSLSATLSVGAGNGNSGYFPGGSVSSSWANNSYYLQRW